METSRLILLFFFTLVMLENKAQTIMCDSIPWSHSKPLSWSDFKALPDSTSSIGALSHSSIKYVVETINDKHYLFSQTYFAPCNSWYKRGDSLLSLAHEQGHFDLDEYIRRSFNKDVLALEDFSKFAVPGIQNVYFASMFYRKVMHAVYDNDTNFHRNELEQKLWNTKIRKMVSQMIDYSGYNYVIKEKNWRK